MRPDRKVAWNRETSGKAWRNMQRKHQEFAKSQPYAKGDCPQHVIDALDEHLARYRVR